MLDLEVDPSKDQNKKLRVKLQGNGNRARQVGPKIYYLSVSPI